MTLSAHTEPPSLWGQAVLGAPSLRPPRRRPPAAAPGGPPPRRGRPGPRASASRSRRPRRHWLGVGTWRVPLGRGESPASFQRHLPAAGPFPGWRAKRARPPYAAGAAGTPPAEDEGDSGSDAATQSGAAGLPAPETTLAPRRTRPAASGPPSAAPSLVLLRGAEESGWAASSRTPTSGEACPARLPALGSQADTPLPRSEREGVRGGGCGPHRDHSVGRERQARSPSPAPATRPGPALCAAGSALLRLASSPRGP